VKLYYTEKGERKELDLGENDYLFMTLGSITADSSYGGQTSVPELIRDRRDGSWSFWDTVARKAPDFGRPDTFYGNIDENKWESFTLTMHDRTLLDRITKYSGDEPGTGALMTWVDSGWLMSIVVPYQPHFPDMPEDTYTLWVTGCSSMPTGTMSRRRCRRLPGRRSSASSSASSASTTSVTRC
jgi:oleate hydratase